MLSSSWTNCIHNWWKVPRWACTSQQNLGSSNKRLEKAISSGKADFSHFFTDSGVRRDDEGFYECNLSHHPPQYILIELEIVEAIAEIIGMPDVYIDEGSELKLECKITHATEKPTYVFW